MNEGLAWCAGFFDGEGCIGNWRGRALSVNITQTDPVVLEKFKKLTGLGRVYGPYVRQKKAWKPCWYYQVYGFERTQQLVILLWKWLSPAKREQAKAALLKARA